MNNNEFEKDTSLGSVLGGFIGSYANRDTNVAFPDWLADRLRQELPELEQDASARLANDIIGAIAGYDKTLHDLNRAVEAGQSKEEWLSEQLEEVYAGMPLNAAGEALQRMEIDLLSSNMQLMGGSNQSAPGGTSAAETESGEWNRYSIKAKIYNIGRQLQAAVLFAAANALNRHLHGEDAGKINAIIRDALQGALKASPEEVKAVVAAAIQVAAEKGFKDILPSNTPIEVICDLAGAAVEAAEALYDAANGDISLTEALDRAGRAVVAAGCRYGAGYLREKLVRLPCGPILVDLLGGLLDHLESPKFFENVYATIRDLAVATWEGIIQSTTVEVIKEGVRRIQQWQ